MTMLRQSKIIHLSSKAVSRRKFGGLSSEAIIVVDLNAKPVKEVQRLDMKQRIRGLHQVQDGSIWVIEDGPKAKLLKLSAK